MLSFIKKSAIFTCTAAILLAGNVHANTSLMDEKPNLFCKGNLCLIDTVGDPDMGRIRNINFGLSNLETYDILKNKKLGMVEWDKTNVLKREKKVYSAGITFLDRYYLYDAEGKRVHSREAALGILLERILGLSKQFTGNVVADQYQNFDIWKVLLKNREELAALVNRVEKEIAATNMQVSRKPVLYIDLKQDPQGLTLTANDMDLVKKYFEPVDLTNDTQTALHINNLVIKLDEFKTTVNSQAKIYPGEGLRKGMLRRMESFCDDFEASKIAPVAIAGLGLIYWNDISNNVKSIFKGKNPWASTTDLSADEIKAIEEKVGKNTNGYTAKEKADALSAAKKDAAQDIKHWVKEHKYKTLLTPAILLLGTSLIHAGLAENDLGLILDILKFGTTAQSREVIRNNKLLATEVYGCLAAFIGAGACEIYDLKHKA